MNIYGYVIEWKDKTFKYKNLDKAWQGYWNKKIYRELAVAEEALKQMTVNYPSFWTKMETRIIPLYELENAAEEPVKTGWLRGLFGSNRRKLFYNKRTVE